MLSGLSLVAAYGLDTLLGEPPNRLHPVAWLGSLIVRAQRHAFASTPARQFVLGSLLALSIASSFAATAYFLERAFDDRPWLQALVTMLLLKPLFAARALREAAFAVRDALARDDLPRARAGLSSLCSRDARQLEAPALIAASVESVAENASDSIVAPLFFFACFGLPGAAFYRAVNTLDAMWGYHGKYEWVGKTSARLDDALNWIPARVTAALFLLVAPFSGASPRDGLKMWRRDAGKTESPNAGRPMATMAGLLGVRLEKTGAYELGDATRPLEAHDITRAWQLVARAAGVWLVIVAAARITRDL